MSIACRYAFDGTTLRPATYHAPVLMDDLSRGLSQWASRGGGFTILVLAFGAVVLAAPIARRLDANRWLTTAALLSIALIVGVTLGNRAISGNSVGFGNPTFACLETGNCWERIFVIDLLWRLNVLLFAPAGLFVALATRRALVTGVVLIAMSACIEVAQGLFGLGAPDPGDLIANSVGGVAGAALATVVPRTQRHEWTLKVITTSILVAGAIAGSAWVAMNLGADARRDALAAEIGRAFVGMTSADIAAEMATPTGPERLFSTTTIRPDYLGQVGESGIYAARYSTQFLGVDRCVFARWDSGGLTLTDGSGAECTAFREQP